MQSKIGSAIEICSTTLVGYIVSVIIGYLWLYPWFNVPLDWTTNMGLTACFVGVSMIVKFISRRIFTSMGLFREKRK